MINFYQNWDPGDFSFETMKQLFQRIDDFCAAKGVNAMLYYDREMVTTRVLSLIARDNADLSIAITSEKNPVAVGVREHESETSKLGDLHSFGLYMRQRLDSIAATKPVILLSSVFNEHLETIPMPNVKIIWFPYGCMMENLDYYVQVGHVKSKRFDSKRHWISLNRLHSHHRTMMAMILLGHDLGLNDEPETGYLYISPKTVDGFESWQDYWIAGLRELPSSITADQAYKLEKGFERLKKVQHHGQPDSKAIKKDFLYHTNYGDRLIHMYEDTVLEIVNGTTFYNPAGYAYCEKALHAILALNLPLFVGNVSTVEGLRLSGFDVFDDVLDHGYDSITDPMQRMFALVESNLELLRNGDLAREVWVKCLPRLLNNVEVAKTMLDRATVMILRDLEHYLDHEFDNHRSRVTENS